MTAHDLRDLLREQVADVTTADLAGAAWTSAVRRRRRRRLAAVGGAALAVALVATGLALHDAGPGRVAPAKIPMPTPPAPAGTKPDTTYQGNPVWWSPDLHQELALPRSPQLPLLHNLHLTAPTHDLADDPIDRAVAAFGRDHEVVLVASDGSLRRLAVPLLPIADEDGNASDLFGPSMLAPDGRHLVFPQPGFVAVYDMRGRRTELNTQGAGTTRLTWYNEDLLALPDARGSGPLLTLSGHLGDDADVAPVPALDEQPALLNPVGRGRTNGGSHGTQRLAQSWGMGPAIPVRDPSAYLSGPAYLSVLGGGKAQLLAFMTGTDDSRWMDAPQVVGWLDKDTVVYESIADDRDLLISWRVGTHTFRRLESLPTGWTTSFADLS